MLVTLAKYPSIGVYSVNQAHSYIDLLMRVYDTIYACVLISMAKRKLGYSRMQLKVVKILLEAIVAGVCSCQCVNGDLKVVIKDKILADGSTIPTVASTSDMTGGIGEIGEIVFVLRA